MRIPLLPFRCAALAAVIVGVAGARAEPPGIVLVIADGTSQELITAARLYSKGAAGRLALEDFPHTAIVRTYSGSDFVTDSSAAATAMARGIKADNRVVGIAAPESSSSPPSLLDLAKRAGWSTAVVTDDSVTGGTPSPFLVEHRDRSDEAGIAAKTVSQLGPRVDFLIGGGRKWFADLVANPAVTYKAGERPVIQETEKRLAEAPVSTFNDWEAFRKFAEAGGDGRPVLATLAPAEFSYYADGLRTLRLRNLAEATVALLEARERPFLLIVEAALPDKASHLNNAKRAIVEVLELDDTLAWMRGHLGPGTLILVTTDHATGGFTLNGFVPIRMPGKVILLDSPVTGQSVITWASGPGGGEDGAPRPTTRTRIETESGKSSRVITEPIERTDPDYAQPALIGIKSALHSGGDVWMLAAGPGSEKVHGYMDNTAIYKLIAGQIQHPPAK